MPDSVVAFANEKVAIVLAPLWVVPEIQAINPSLNWQTAPVPQLPDVDPLNWASMWIETVPKNAPHPQEAWKFVSFLASAKAQQLLFESAVKERNLAQVPANKAVSALASQNPVNAPLVAGLASAKTFYTGSLTHDNDTALNSRLIKYLEDAVNSTIKRQDPNKTLETLNLGFNQVLSQYRLVTPLPTPTGR
jgi:ABC-type glycerol-3-phosphate transport system substrate-binding protein